MIGTPSVVSRPTGLPRPPRLRARSWLNALRTLAHRSRLGVARVVRQHAAEYSRASAVSPICLAAGRAYVRAMRRTDFCLLTCLRTSTRASPVPDASRVFTPARSERSPVSRQCDSLWWVARISLLGTVAAGFLFPSRRVQPTLWCLCRFLHAWHSARAACALIEAAKTVRGSLA